MSGPVTALAAALELAEEGLPVFPCQQDKRPYTVHGLKDATKAPKQITSWWRRWPGALVGVPTGRASGLLVIDTDPAGADWHRENDHRLACGRVHRTRRGHHLLYAYPSDSEVRNSAGRLAPGVDVPGEGGYMIWWPAHGLEAVGGMEDLGDPPEWLQTDLTDGRPAPHTGSQEAGEYITEGRRNHFLSREAYRLRKQGCSIDQIAEVLRALSNTRCKPPLPDAELVVIANGKARVPPGDGSAPGGLPPLDAYEGDAAQEDARHRTAGATGDRSSGNGASSEGFYGGEEWTEPPPRAKPYPPIPPISELRIDPAKLAAARLTPRCVVEEYLFADVAVFPGPGGTGKTTLFLFEVVHIVLGRPLYGLQVHTPGVVVLVTAEDRRELLLARLHRLMEEMQLNDEERAKVCADVLIWDVTGSVCRLTELDRNGNVVLTGLADAVVERFREVSPVMVGLDPVISFGAGERIVNDNENSLILAARHIVRGLGCCVRLICHTGQDAARSMVLDQYASRGGSALSDGSRMVAVLQVWEADAEKLTPPIGFTLADDEDGMVLARPKLSFVPKHQRPHIWLKRRGWVFEHFIATRTDPEAEAKARADQLERFLISELAAGSRYTRNTLTDTGVIKPRDKFRAALSALEAAGRVVDAPNPRTAHTRGGARVYLHPVAFGSPNTDGEATGNGGKK